MPTARALLVVVALATIGCQQAPPPAPPGPVAVSASAERLRAEGDERRKQGDHASALRAYEQAVGLQPEDLGLRYLLAITLVELDRRDDAILAFQWLVGHGAATREEVRIAHQWLAEAGALGAARSSTAASPAPRAVSSGQLVGRTGWHPLDPDQALPVVQIVLVGDDATTRGRRYAAKVPLNERYRIDSVQPGRYRVVAGVGMTKLWRLTVTVREWDPTTLDLTPAASTAPPDALKPLSS